MTLTPDDRAALVLDRLYRHQTTGEIVRLIYWERDWATVRELRGNQMGRPWEIPVGLFTRLYDPHP